MSTFEIVFLSLIGSYALWSYWHKKNAPRRIKKAGDGLVTDRAAARANPRDFRHVDAKWYDECEQELRRMGYELIGNVALEGISTTYVRACASPDGEQCVGIYHFKVPGLRGLWCRRHGITDNYAIEAGTSFRDGTSINTTTVPVNRLPSAPEMVRRAHVHADSTIRHVAMVHAQRVAELLVERPDLEIVPVRTFEDLVASMEREQAIKREHYEAVGGLTREDLVRIGGADNRDVANDMYDQIEELRKKDAG